MENKKKLSTQQIVLLITLRMLLVILLLLGFAILGVLTIRKEISLFLFLICYAATVIITVVAYKMIIKSLGLNRPPREKDTAEDKPENDEVEKIPLIGWLLLGTVVIIIGMIIYGSMDIDIAFWKNAVTRSVNWLSGQSGIFWLIVISVISLVLWRYWPKRKPKADDTTATGVKSKAAVKKWSWSWSLFQKQMTGITILATAFFIVAAGFFLLWKGKAAEKEVAGPSVETMVNRALNAAKKQNHLESIKIDPKPAASRKGKSLVLGQWVLLEKGSTYLFERGCGVGLRYETRDLDVHLRVARDRYPSVGYDISFEQNGVMNITNDTKDDSCKTLWGITPDRDVWMRISIAN